MMMNNDTSFKYAGFAASEAVGGVTLAGEPSSTPCVRRKSAESCLDGAVKLGQAESVRQMLEREPLLALVLNQDGFSPLHLACWIGNVEIAMKVVNTNPRSCLVKDKFGRTPLHTAAMKGRTRAMEFLLGASPESIQEVTHTRETPLHLSISHHQNKASLFLLHWLARRPNYAHLTLNSKDCSGNTALHLATSRKQLHIIQVLLSQNSESSSVNALSDAGLTALDILDILPPSRKVDMKIEKALRLAGALRAREAPIQITTLKNYEELIDFSTQTRPSKTNNRQVIYNNVVLLIAALFATITFHAVLNLPGNIQNSSTKSHEPFHKKSSYLTGLFLWFNSAAFLASVATILSLAHDLPLKPLLLVSLFSLFGAYICSIITASPRAALVVLYIGSPFLVFAAASGQAAFYAIGLQCFKGISHSLFLHGQRTNYSNI